MRIFSWIALTLITITGHAGTIKLEPAVNKALPHYLEDIERSIPSGQVRTYGFSRIVIEGELTIDVSALPSNMAAQIQDALGKKQFYLGDTEVDLRRANLNYLLVQTLTASAPGIRADTYELMQRQQAGAWCGLNLSIDR